MKSLFLYGFTIDVFINQCLNYLFMKKTVLFAFLLSLLSFVFVSCQTKDIQEESINLNNSSSRHFQTEDLSFDGEKFYLSPTLEQALANGVSEEEFFCAKIGVRNEQSYSKDQK